MDTKKTSFFLGAAAVEHLFHASHNCPPWQYAPPAPSVAPISQTLHHCRPLRPYGTPLFIMGSLFLFL